MSHKYRAEQFVAIGGSECGTEIELKMVVNFKVHPGSPQTMIDPAEEPSVEIDTARFFLGAAEVEVPDAVYEQFAASGGFKEWLMNEAIQSIECARDEAADAKRERLQEDRA